MMTGRNLCRAISAASALRVKTGLQGIRAESRWSNPAHGRPSPRRFAGLPIITKQRSDLRTVRHARGCIRRVRDNRRWRMLCAARPATLSPGRSGPSDSTREVWGMIKLPRTGIPLRPGACLARVPGTDVRSGCEGREFARKSGGMDVEITLRADGRQHRIAVDPRTTLLDTLRERLGIYGPKKGCDHGHCGACTILLDGRRAISCLPRAGAHDGAEIITAEGLAACGALHPMQSAFVDDDAFQCGY